MPYHHGDGMKSIVMTIRYKNSFSEVLMFYLHMFIRSPFVWGLFTLLTAVDAPEMWEAIWEEESDSVEVEPWVKVVVGALMIVGSFLMMFAMMFIILIASVGMDRRSRLERVVTLTDSALIEEIPFRRTEYQWQGMVRLRQTKSHLFIYNASTDAAIIPRRAFESDAQWEGFHEFCTEKIKRA